MGEKNLSLIVAYSCWVGHDSCSVYFRCPKCIILMVGISPFLILFCASDQGHSRSYAVTVCVRACKFMVEISERALDVIRCMRK